MNVKVFCNLQIKFSMGGGLKITDKIKRKRIGNNVLKSFVPSHFT
jgi:hypothetical protein